MIERLLLMLRDIDYRVRFSVARRIGVLFQTWDGHEELFQDVWLVLPELMQLLILLTDVCFYYYIYPHLFFLGHEELFNARDILNSAITYQICTIPNKKIKNTFLNYKIELFKGNFKKIATVYKMILKNSHSFKKIKNQPFQKFLTCVKNF